MQGSSSSGALGPSYGHATASLQKLPTSEISSSITFAALIYLHLFFSFVYFLANLAIVSEKVSNYKFNSNLQEVLLLPTYTIWCAGEVSRFYFAYTGNLKERVPQMSAFLLMTIFPQLPTVIYLAFYQEYIFPFDEAAGALMFAMLIIELVVGYVTLHTLIQRQTAQFYRLCQEEEDKERSRITS
jgi:transmembrane protein 17